MPWAPRPRGDSAPSNLRWPQQTSPQQHCPPPPPSPGSPSALHTCALYQQHPETQAHPQEAGRLSRLPAQPEAAPCLVELGCGTGFPIPEQVSFLEATQGQAVPQGGGGGAAAPRLLQVSHTWVPAGSAASALASEQRAEPG